ncbi:phosducin protein [Pelomyxa schiedti]|nr:phosducin protein [Pelomyxa schiedti]
MSHSSTTTSASASASASASSGEGGTMSIMGGGRGDNPWLAPPPPRPRGDDDDDEEGEGEPRVAVEDEVTASGPPPGGMRSKGNTGPKGVMADYADASHHAQVRLQQKQQRIQEEIAKHLTTTTTVAEDEEHRRMEQQVEEEFDLEDKAFFEEYKRKRMEEMIRDRCQPTYGTLKELHTDDYMDTIQNMDPDTTVFIHIFQPRFSVCTLINNCLESLANRHTHTLFCKISKRDALNTFDDKSLPAILVYKKSELEKAYMKFTNEIGFSFSDRDIESVFVRDGLLSETAAPTTTTKPTSSPKSTKNHRKGH